jgi:hypothetical protein
VDNYAVAISHEVIKSDGTKLWDDEIAFHNLTPEQVVLVENGLGELIGKLKAAVSGNGS